MKLLILSLAAIAGCAEFVSISNDACVPDCEGRSCGGDGCGGSCGPGCVPQASCDQASGSCLCTDGFPPCGEACCEAGETCDEESGRCICTGSCGCVPDCVGRGCGLDGCGGSCGECGPSEVCLTGGLCCQPDCEGKTCGPDGCGGACEPGCATNETCGDEGTECICIPDCEGRECGPDGCEGTCGPACGGGHYCADDGHCCCRYEECGGLCCRALEVCDADGRCCNASCIGRECGTDGCGGICGPGCSPGAACDEATGMCL